MTERERERECSRKIMEVREKARDKERFSKKTRVGQREERKENGGDEKEGKKW